MDVSSTDVIAYGTLLAFKIQVPMGPGMISKINKSVLEKKTSEVAL